MQLYSSRPVAAAWQAVGDAVAVVTVIAAVWLSQQVAGAIRSLGGFGRQLEDAGSGLSATFADAGTALEQVPLVGGGVAAPLRDASGSADDLAAAGAALTSGVEALAAAVGLALWLLPVLVVVLAWLVPRVRFVRRARASRRLAATRAGRDLLALRALVGQPTSRLLAAVDDPVAALRGGDEAAVAALAALELRGAGVRVASA